MAAATGSGSSRHPAHCGFIGALLFLGLLFVGAATGHAQTTRPGATICGDPNAKDVNKDLKEQPINIGDGTDNQPDLVVSGKCNVQPRLDYYFAKVNIISGGQLIFKEGAASDVDKVTNFWAKSIIIENGGAMKAGVDADKPYGTNLHTLNIILYGADQTNHGDPAKYPNGDPVGNAAGGDTCLQPNCGVPSGTADMWNDNGKNPFPGCGVEKANSGANCLPGQPTDFKDYFYQYAPVYGTKTGYYGYKVLAVGYGGTLQLYGSKGTSGGAAADQKTIEPNWTLTQSQTETGTSWIRLAGGETPGVDLQKDGKKLVLDRSVATDWQQGDKIVVTTTDYLPSHSEELTIDTVTGSTVTVTQGAQWPHVGKAYDLSVLAKAGDGFKKAFTDQKLTVPKSAETRAAVALLTRSIRIVSGGDFAGDYFECPGNNVPKELSHDKSKDIPVAKEKCATARNGNYSFGGHTSFRQGFTKLQLQGVEFHQMGQGGRMAHYPVHFHMARQVSPKTYIKDSSVSESMTRWYVLHSTLGVSLQRNVGWKSIGHGYFLEDGTETDNKFYANIGIYARGGVQSKEQNPRNIPGIVAQNGSEDAFRYRADVVHPTVFWITNGWNEFVGNMAAGAGVCGTCFWFVPAANHDMVETDPMNDKVKGLHHMQWSGYAGRQTVGHEGETPIKLFSKNYCTTAEYSLNNTNGVASCNGVRFVDDADDGRIGPVTSIAPAPNKTYTAMDMYYPYLTSARAPTVCDPSLANGAAGACSGPYDAVNTRNNPDDANIAKRCQNTDPATCATAVIDQYTSSFNWAETNFSSIWLRTPGWYLLDNSFISDVQNGGVTLISGGDYSRSSSPLGYWAMASRSIFVGETQPQNKFAKASGPSKSADSNDLACDNSRGDACVSKEHAVAYPKSNWGTGQRLFNIYDGPAYQDANAFLNITKSDCQDRNTCLYFGMPGVRRQVLKTGNGFLPNAAIGWKQPNGFYYPPAFHSKNLFFDKVDIRHYVLQPLHTPGTYLTDTSRVTDEFVGGVEGATNVMGTFTDVDRQTELSDDDGTLTGFQNTISVNEDRFFGGPTQAPECKSNIDIDPAFACAGKAVATKPPPTARTSPYDYVTTVVYPGCAIDAPPGDAPYSTDLNAGPKWMGACGSTLQGDNEDWDDKPGKRKKTLEYTGGDWSKDCGGPFCFGVPLYRQYLTGENKSEREQLTWAQNCATPTNPDGSVKDKCDFPFARMAGTGLWQRSVMTVNNGKFYLDTTRKKDTQKHSEALGKKDDQSASYVECDYKDKPKDPKIADNCQPRSVNVFQAKKAYFVFVLFAKQTTKQTYQIYVGDKFKPASDLKAIKMTDFNNRFNTKPGEHKLDAKMIKGPDGQLDVLEVTLDFSKVTGVEFDPKKATSETCKPASFCSWRGPKCSCSLNPNDPRLLLNPQLQNVCEKTCNEWAVKDLDCPAGGCLGFSFTLPDNFEAKDQYKRPTPDAFVDSSDKAAWKKALAPTGQAPDSNQGGACYYSATNTPGKGACKVAD